MLFANLAPPSSAPPDQVEVQVGGVDQAGQGEPGPQGVAVHDPDVAGMARAWRQLGCSSSNRRSRSVGLPTVRCGQRAQHSRSVLSFSALVANTPGTLTQASFERRILGVGEASSRLFSGQT